MKLSNKKDEISCFKILQNCIKHWFSVFFIAVEPLAFTTLKLSTYLVAKLFILDLFVHSSLCASGDIFVSSKY